MNPAQRLQAAIEKLEKQRAATEPVRHDSEWVVTHEASETERHIFVLDSHSGGYDGSVIATCWSTAAADLIVTLHRTIDAQLAILRFGVKRQQAVDLANRIRRGGDLQTDAAALELALADAILGRDS